MAPWIISIHGQRQRLGQALSAERLGEGEAHPAAFDELAIGVGESGRGDDASVRQLRACLVADGIERREHIARQLVRLVQDRRDQLRIEIRKGAGRGQFIQPRDAGERVGDLGDGGCVGHGAS